MKTEEKSSPMYHCTTTVQQTLWDQKCSL